MIGHNYASVDMGKTYFILRVRRTSIPCRAKIDPDQRQLAPSYIANVHVLLAFCLSLLRPSLGPPPSYSIWASAVARPING